VVEVEGLEPRAMSARIVVRLSYAYLLFLIVRVTSMLRISGGRHLGRFSGSTASALLWDLVESLGARASRRL
jgi:hypothetical protein